MIRRIIFLFIFALGLQAQESKITGMFIGMNTGSNQTIQMDMGFATYRSGYTNWGFHVGIDKRSADAEQGGVRYTADRSQWGTTKMVDGEARGVSLGGFLNVGRGFVVAGAQRIQTQDYRLAIANDGTTTVQQNVPGNKFGAYAKVGYVIGRVTLYGGHSSYYGTTAGIGYVF